MLVKRERVHSGKIKKNALRRKGTLSAWRKRAKDESTSFI